MESAVEVFNHRASTVDSQLVMQVVGALLAPAERGAGAGWRSVRAAGEAVLQDGGESFFARARSWLEAPLVRISDTELTPLSVVAALIVLLLAFQFSRFLQRLLQRGMHALGVDSEGTIGTFGRIIHYTVVVLGLLIAVQQLGFKLETILAAGAVFAIAFGFAMQNIAQNFVSGVILLVERSIKQGDVLEVEGRMVRVEEMGIRSTVARTRDEEEIIIPNATLVQNTVKNLTLRDSAFRLRALVGVSYGSDMDLVEKTLVETARALDWREKGRAPRVHLLEFGDSSVRWEVSVWTQSPWSAPRQLSRLNKALWWALREKGITIAYPQLDLHVDSPRRITGHEAPAPLPAAGGEVPPK